MFTMLLVECSCTAAESYYLLGELGEHFVDFDCVLIFHLRGDAGGVL